ncbi:putative MFS family arabinose efflux permease [Pseudosporangium ferrugineum]|uniref:Putative MFS family arabinose efflux permease n=2 Tax=Pseudosporangium ferrugineum TaxID=439699 RepID=A0A2T0SAA2_9ACTN|nr:putative MFS family arabinose efflux permease [Pseudosporangium ferrugineum]
MIVPEHGEDMTVTAAPTHTEVNSGVSFWSIAAVFAISMAFSTVPTPLYPIYQAEDGFTAFTVTVVFAAYAVGVVTSLLLAGHISDRTGRRRVLLAAIGLESLAAVLFLTRPDLPGLLLARFVTGLGVGIMAATATAYLLELHAAHRPGAGRGRFELVSAAANLGGLGAGTLVAGALAQFVSAPLRTPYVVFLVLLALSAVAVLAAPETVTVPAVAPRYRPQRIRIAASDRAGYLTAALGAFSAFAVFGLFTSLAPSFVAGSLHHPGRLLAGVVAFAVFGAAATAQAASGSLTPARRFTAGLAAEATGLIVLGAGMNLPSLTIFLLGGVIAGAGAGLLFKAAVGTVAATAAPAVRGEALAGLFLIAYLGLIGPALGLGIATRHLTATTAMLWFSGLLLTLLGATAVARSRS